MGSVIIHLRASGRNSYDTMVAFCKHGGMNNFILSLLKEKEVFNSLPAGEISIEIQVRQDEEDLNYEAKEFEGWKKVRTTENECSLSCPAIDAADKSHVIKENLLLQYECVADEIDPLQFAETFVNRGILDESFFKDLKHYRRGQRAVLFLNEVLEKGKEALYALTEGLKDMGCEDLVAKLCFANRRSKQQWNKGNLDLVKVELEVPDKHFGEDSMWSCRLKCAVEKNIYGFPNTLAIDNMTNMKRMNTCDEETMQLSFEALFEIIVDRVDYQHLMAFLPMDMLSLVQRKEVFNIKQKDGPSAATRRILEILKAQKMPGKYRALVDALQRNYPSLVRALTSYKRQDFNMESRENLSKLFSSSIAERMSVQQVLPHLLKSRVIVQLEKEMLESELRNYGNIRAAQLLFLYLPVHVENWYIEFLKALCHSEQTELAKFIDESFVQKYLVKTDIIPKRTDDGAWGNNLIDENSSEMSLTPEKYMDYDYFNKLRSTEEQKLDETGLKKGPIGYPLDTPQKYAINNAARWVLTSEFQDGGEDLLETKSVLESKHEEYTDLGIEMDSIVSRFSKKHYLTKSLDLDDESSDSAYMSDSEDAKEEEYISLRMYQEEMARPALQGRNVIILAPTGSGKHRVACRIIQGHFRRMKHQCANGMAVLLVKDVILAHQLGRTCKDLLPAYRTQVIAGETKWNQTISIEEHLKRCKILVLTAQHFLYNLMNGKIKSIAHISLMIFDECHHCKDNHPYNKIMQYYMDLKLTSETCMSPLPQIIGLTSSLDIGEAVDVPQAKENIIKLMANLDAELINTITENVDELRQHVHMPPIPEIETIICVRPRANDVFSVSITKIMNTIENMMRNAEVLKKVDYFRVLNAPSEKGSEPYIQWLSEMWMITSTIHNPEVRRFTRPCFKHLQWYNEALIIYNDARVKDAVDFLKEKMDDWQDRPNMDAIQQCLLMLYRAGTQPKYIQEVPNPKLIELKRLILTSFREKSVEESRCIVFVKTRALAGALVSWMTDTPELNVLNPTVFVGANAAKDQGGITRFQQGDKLAEFRRGRYKIMVAISVAEEGLDIQQCNLVLRYDHVTHEIAMVQSRGRARAMDSKYHVVAQFGKGTAEKEEINIKREKLMQKAIIELQMDIQRKPQSIKINIRDLQEEDKLDRDLLAQKKKQKQKKQEEYELRCVQCNEFICMSSDIRKIQNAHNVVIDPTLRDRVVFTKNLLPTFQDDEIEFNGKIFCKCHEDFGQVCTYRHQEYPVIKIEKFIIVDQRGEQTNCKKWKQVPFIVPQLTTEDRRRLLVSRDME